MDIQELLKINEEHKFINGQLRKELMDNIESQDRLYERNKTLEEENKIMEKYFELISDLGYDYDGSNNAEDLKKLIDELVRFAKLGRVCNIKEPIYVNKDKSYNILGEEIKK